MKHDLRRRREAATATVVWAMVVLASCALLPPALGAPDAFEADDTWPQAKAITVDGVKQRHTIDPLGDLDWVKFVATAGRVYVVETFSVGATPVDTFLLAYPPGPGSQPVSDDNSGTGQNALLVLAATAIGTYYVRVNEKGDDATGSYDVSVTEWTSGLPDLVIKTLTVDPTAANLGASVAITAVERNQGAGPAAVHVLNIYKHSAAAPAANSDGDYRWQVGGLAPNTDSKAFGQSFVPGSAGARTAWAYTDSYNLVAETNNNNNTASANYTVGAGGPPDLIIPALSVAPNPAALGSQVTLSVTEQNAGAGVAGAHRLSAWGNRSAAPAVGTNGDSNWDIPTLAAGASVTRTWTYKPGYAWPRLAQARADALGAVAESNEGNNTRTYAYLITAAPDLIIPALTVTPNPAVLGAQVTLSVTEQNAGAVAAGAHRLSVWGHRTTTPAVGTNGDSNWDIASLAAGASVTRTWTYKPGYAWPRLAQARADALGAVPESDEGNNTRSFSYAITAAAAAASSRPRPRLE
jgi:subtilase family serine protease